MTSLKLRIGIIALILAIGLGFTGYSIFHSQYTQSVVALKGFNPSGGGTYRLQTPIGTTDTSINLSSFKEPISNIPYTMTYLNTSIGYGTLDPQQNTRKEFISFTGVTQNSDGTAQLTGVTRGMSFSYPFTASTTLRQTHSGQSIFILSDSPQLFAQYAVKQNNELIPGAWTASSTNPWSYDQAYGITSSSTSLNIPYVSWIFNNFVDIYNSQSITGVKTFSSKPVFSVVPTSAQAPAVGSDVANKTYVDGVALVSAPNADTVTKGVVEEATTQEINSFTAAGGTGARLYVNPAQLQFSNFASTTYRAATSSVPAGASTYRIATTTSLLIGQSLMIWAKCEANYNSTLGLYIKPVNAGTSTIDKASDANDAAVGFMGFQGVYSSTTASQNVEIYIGDVNASKNYFDLCNYGGIQYVRY